MDRNELHKNVTTVIVRALPLSNVEINLLRWWQKAHVRRHNPPSRYESTPSLRLPTDKPGAKPLIFGIGRREIGTERRNDRPRQLACEIARRPPRTKRAKSFDAVKVFAIAIAHDERAVPEETVERCDVIADKRLLVRIEQRRHLGQYIRAVDFHGASRGNGL